MNAYFVEARVRHALSDLRRARRRTLASAAAVIALAVVAAAGVATSIYTGAGTAVAVGLVATVGVVCFAVWGGRAMRIMARLEERTALRRGDDLT